MKIRPVGAELYHADGQTDRHDEANSRFSQICESTKKCAVLSVHSIELYRERRGIAPLILNLRPTWR